MKEREPENVDGNDIKNYLTHLAGAYKLYVRIRDDEGNEVRREKRLACV
jgi:hypothetical protein